VRSFGSGSSTRFGGRLATRNHVGVPAGEGLSAFETMVAQPGYQTIEDELGRPKPNFLHEELAEGRRREAAVRAEQEAVQRAQRVLEGRDG
jgi:hypothetical protein